MADDKKSIQVGFTNGQVVSMKLVPAEFDKLIEAIKSETSWHEIKDDKRTLTIRADRVDFFGTEDEKEQRRTGF
jgi:hypothetical protein